MKITLEGKDGELKEVEVSVISISAKCSDLCHSVLMHEGVAVAEHDGYVPRLMPGKHYGDYVMLDIDLETGRILNWKNPVAFIVQSTEWVKTDA